jgi:hypothetical protein
MQKMIEGTKPYRTRSSTEKNSEIAGTTHHVEAMRPEGAPSENSEPKQRSAPHENNAVGRREWFRSLVPAMGSGLVEILRTSNNLKRDLEEARDK